MLKKLNVDEKLAQLPKFLEKLPDVLVVFQFGSYGTEYQMGHSDIDFAILFDHKLSLAEEIRILDDLANYLGTERVDLVNLNKAPITIQFRAISTGKILYEKDYYTTCDYIEYVLKVYQDYAIDLHYFYKEYDQALKEAYGYGGQGED